MPSKKIRIFNKWVPNIDLHVPFAITVEKGNSYYGTGSVGTKHHNIHYKYTGCVTAFWNHWLGLVGGRARAHTDIAPWTCSCFANGGNVVRVVSVQAEAGLSGLLLYRGKERRTQGSVGRGRRARTTYHTLSAVAFVVHDSPVNRSHYVDPLEICTNVRY